jgi:hypothetical protein
MKRIILFIAAVLLPIVLSAQGTEIPRIAVFDPVSSGTSIDDGTKIAVREIISSTIVNTGKYSIVERSLLEKIMEEQQFSNSGAVDDLQATEIGKLAGANKVVLSVVTLTGGRNMLSIKLIDVRTATIERQKVKIVTSGELLDIIEPLTLETLNLSSGTTYSPIVASTSQDNFQTEAISPSYIPEGEINMYGVDYSFVQIYGANETPQQFAQAFRDINAIFTSEADKYDFSYFTGKKVALYTAPTDALINNINWNYAYSSSQIPQKQSVEEMIKRYNLPHSDGTGMVIIAWLLDKSEGIGYYDLVFFDIKTRKIIFDTTVTADAGGMSLRNYWANSIYEIIDQRKFRKQIQEVLSGLGL